MLAGVAFALCVGKNSGYFGKERAALMLHRDQRRGHWDFHFATVAVAVAQKQLHNAPLRVGTGPPALAIMNG